VVGFLESGGCSCGGGSNPYSISATDRLAVDMDIHGYRALIYPCVDIRLRLTIDVSIDISTSFNLNCNVTNFEYKIIPLARQFSLRT